MYTLISINIEYLINRNIEVQYFVSAKKRFSILKLMKLQIDMNSEIRKSERSIYCTRMQHGMIYIFLTESDSHTAPWVLDSQPSPLVSDNIPFLQIPIVGPLLVVS